jgi:hypothetical protein
MGNGFTKCSGFLIFEEGMDYLNELFVGLAVMRGGRTLYKHYLSAMEKWRVEDE